MALWRWRSIYVRGERLMQHVALQHFRTRVSHIHPMSLIYIAYSSLILSDWAVTCRIQIQLPKALAHWRALVPLAQSGQQRNHHADLMFAANAKYVIWRCYSCIAPFTDRYICAWLIHGWFQSSCHLALAGCATRTAYGGASTRLGSSLVVSWAEETRVSGLGMTCLLYTSDAADE